MDPQKGRPAGIPLTVGAAVARLRSTRGSVVGTGFVVGDRRLVTCAHVVQSALGRSDAMRPRDEELVIVDFPLAAPGTTLRTRVEVWLPPRPDDSGDVAVLSILDPMPVPISPVRLVAADDHWGHAFRTFGFPKNRDHGVWTTGLLRARQAAGWIQMEGSSTGYPIEPGFSGGAVWDDELAGVVGMTVAADSRTDLHAAYLIPTDTLLRTWPPLAESALPASPYRGLYPFRERDAATFFGREDLTARLVREIRRSPLVAVVGPSGSGKSSVVFAGLVPRLLQTEDWTVVSMRPSQASSPLFALAAVLLPVLEPDRSETERLTMMESLVRLLADGRLPEVVDRVLVRARSSQLLLVVDQLEEVFARSSDDVVAFGSTLLSALRVQADRPAAPLRVVLTLRADFLGQALRFPAMATALESTVTTVGQMGRDQLRDIIEKPLPSGVSYEPGLVERILADVGEAPGSLPLLEFALTLLWERQERGMLTHRSYEALGGVDGALASYAERVYSDQLVPDEQEEVRRLLIQLVRPTGMGTPVRRVARRAEMSDAQWQLGQRLAATRLVVADRDAAGVESVELVHEALIAEWARLDQWVKADLAFRTWQEQLRAAMSGWENAQHDSGALLRGAPLAEAEKWLKERPEDLTEREQRFIGAGRALRGRSLRRLRIAVATLALLLLISGTLGVVAVWQSRRATDQAHAAASGSLVTQAAQLATTQPDTALLLSAAAYRQKPTPEASRLLTRLASESRDVDRLLPTGMNPLQGVAFSPASADVLLLSNSKQLELWSIRTRKATAVLTEVPGQPIQDTTVGPDGHTVAFSTQTPPAIWLWYPDEDRVQPIAELPPYSYPTLAFSPDGRTLGSCTDQGIQLWSVDPLGATSVVPGTAPGNEDGASCTIRFTAGGRIAYIAGEDLVTWDVATQREATRNRLPGAGDPADQAAVHAFDVFPTASGSLAFVCFDNGSLMWWDLARGADAGGLDIGCPQEVVQGRAGRYALFLQGVGSLAVVDLAERQVVGSYPQWPAYARTSLSPDGATIAWAAGSDLLALSSIHDPSGFPWAQTVDVAARSHDGDTIIAASSTGGVIAWQPGSRREATVLVPPAGHLSATLPVTEVSDDGRLFATTAHDPGQVEVTDLLSGTRRSLRIMGGSGPVLAVAFDPGGRFVAAANSAEVDVWPLEERSTAARMPLTAGLATGVAAALAVRPDGRQVAVVEASGLVVLRGSTEHSAQRRLPFTDATAVQFSWDGGMLAVATLRDTYVWDLSGRPETARSLPGASQTFVPAFSPDGRYVAASGSQEGSGLVMVWRLSDLAQLGTVSIPGSEGDTAEANDVTFTPDRHGIAVATGQGVFTGAFDGQSALAHACHVVGRDLTRAEWERYAAGVDYAPPCH